MDYNFDRENMKKLFDGHLDVAVLTAQAFVDSIDALLKHCNQEFLTKKCDLSQKAIHQMKGAVAVFGKTELLEKIKNIEANLKKNEFDRARDEFNQIQIEINRFKTQLITFVMQNQDAI